MRLLESTSRFSRLRSVRRSAALCVSQIWRFRLFRRPQSDPWAPHPDCCSKAGPRFAVRLYFVTPAFCRRISVCLGCYPNRIVQRVGLLRRL